jgi:hypothetical protein
MNYNWRRTLVLSMACLLSVAGCAEASTRASYRTSLDGGAARLIVYRTPFTGKFVFVNVYVDDVVVGTVPYGGRRYEGFLKAGHHVISLLPTPLPTWPGRPPTIVNMRSGETYKFAAVPNGEGNLILRPRD